VQQVHVDARRVGDLDDEDPVTWNSPDAGRVDAAGEAMKAVENEPNVWMLGASHDLPGISMIMDIPPPGERLVADAQSALLCQVPQLMKVLCGAIDPAERLRGNR
jgi:hypothetical protein